MRGMDIYVLDEDNNAIKLQGDEATCALKFQDFAKSWNERNKNSQEEWLPRVGLDTFEDSTVSTVMLPFDHRWSEDEKPQLFETMIFWNDEREWTDQERYSTYDEAVIGHKRAIDKVLKDIIDKAHGNTENDQPGTGGNN